MATRREVFQAAIDSRAATTGAAQFEAATRRMSRGARRVASDVGRADVAMASTAKSAALVASRLAGLAAIVGGGVGLRSAISTIVDFDRAMSNLRVVTGATNRELAILERQARRLGASTAFTSSQAASAQTFLGRAGFRPSQIRAATPSTLNLALLGEIDLGTAADIASNVLSQFQIEAEQTSRVVDVLANTANSSNTNILQLAEAMKFAGTTAGPLGRSVEEVAAAIGVLGNSGIQASLAGTNLRGILLSLIDPSEEAANAIRRLGLTLDQVDPSRRGIAEIFSALRGIDPRSANIIFGRRNVGGALTLARGVEGVSALETANLSAEGTAERGARVLANDLRGSFDALKSAIESIVQSAGDEGLGKVLKNLVTTTTDFVRLLDDGADEFAALYKALNPLQQIVPDLFGKLFGIGVAAKNFAEHGDASRFAEQLGVVLEVSRAEQLKTSSQLGGTAAATARFGQRPSPQNLREVLRAYFGGTPDPATPESIRDFIFDSLRRQSKPPQSAIPGGRLGPALPPGFLPEADSRTTPIAPIGPPLPPPGGIPDGRLGPRIPRSILGPGEPIGPPEPPRPAGQLISTEAVDRAKTLNEVARSLTFHWENFKFAALDAGSVLSTALFGIEDAIISIIDGTKDWGEAFEDVGRDILRQLQRILIRQIIVNAISGISSSIPGLGLNTTAAQHGTDTVFSGPSSGYAAPLTLHGTERVRVEPVGASGGGMREPVVIHQTVNNNIVANDAQSFNERVMGTLVENQREATQIVLNQISSDDGMTNTVRRL